MINHDPETLAKEIAWQDRSLHDVALDREHLWDNLTDVTRVRYLQSAKVAIAFHEKRIDLRSEGSA